MANHRILSGAVDIYTHGQVERIRGKYNITPSEFVRMACEQFIKMESGDGLVYDGNIQTLPAIGETIKNISSNNSGQIELGQYTAEDLPTLIKIYPVFSELKFKLENPPASFVAGRYNLERTADIYRLYLTV